MCAFLLGLLQGLNSTPLAPKAIIMPLDQAANAQCRWCAATRCLGTRSHDWPSRAYSNNGGDDGGGNAWQRQTCQTAGREGNDDAYEAHA